jgi:hypothetical protein
METVRQLQKKYCSRAMVAAIFVGLFIILAGQKSIGKGLVLGTIFSVVNFVLIGQSLPHRIGKTKGKTFFLSLGSIFFRYTLMAFPIFLAIKYEQFNLVSVVFGLFFVQILILGDNFLSFISSTRGKQV